MKHSRIILCVALLSIADMQITYAQVGIGTATPDPSAQLEVSATDRGLLIPRITIANRPASPADGLMIWQTDGVAGLYVFTGGLWVRLARVNETPMVLSSSTANPVLSVRHTGVNGSSINVANTVASNIWPAVVVATNSSSWENAGIYSQTTGAARAIIGEVTSTAAADVAVRGVNLRTTTGIGVEGVGFNGVSGRTNYREGFGVFGHNVDIIGPTTANAAGVGGYGFLGVFGRSIDPVNGAGLYSNDNIIALGNLSVQGTKNFRIDHPLAPTEKYLNHFAIESNEVLNMYRGSATFNAAGEATVTLPDYFEAINTNITYHLTPIGFATTVYIKSKMAKGQFVIAGGRQGGEVCWQVMAERNDEHMRLHPELKRVETPKTTAFRTGSPVK